jgi:transcriptional regulator with XRE-family HTH domain
VIGEKIKMARILAKMTQAEFAEKIGRSRVTVGRWESGEREPSAGEIVALAALLNTTVSYLMGEIEDPAPPTVRNAEPHAASEKRGFRVKQKQRTNPRLPTLEDFARIREASKNLDSFEDSDLRAAAEMAQATLRAIERERVFRTAQQDGALKSA